MAIVLESGDLHKPQAHELANHGNNANTLGLFIFQNTKMAWTGNGTWKSAYGSKFADKSAMNPVTTFVLSQHSTSWEIHRFDETVTKLGSGVLLEGDALEMAIIQAEAVIPSQVLRISVSGECTVMATFREKNQRR